MSTALEVAQLTKHFGRTAALDGVTLAVLRGAAVALLGPNGAGKTTFMRLCATLLRPTGGSIRIFAHDAVNAGAAARKHIGLLSHESYLYPDLTATENLRFYARLFGMADPEERVEELVEQMDLTGWAHRPVRTLSRGAQQRCALARVLLHQPDLLFLDEPFTGLDLQAATVLRDVLRRTNQAGTTIVMSTHDMPQVFALCSSAIVLNRGRLAWQGPISAHERDRFEAHYTSLTGKPATQPGTTHA